MPGILIADDNANIRILLRTTIETRPTLKVCGEAGNGAEAIELATQLLPDLVLMDFSMPVVNGAIAASLLKKALPHIKVVLFTLHADIPTSLQRSLGIDLLIRKTEDVNQLPDKLLRLLSGETTDSTTPPPPRAPTAIA